MRIIPSSPTIETTCRNSTGGADALRADDRAPAGDDLRRPAGGRKACRGRRLRDAVSLGPLLELSGTGRQPDDRRLGVSRRPGPGHDANRPGHARLAGDVPAAGKPREGGGDGTPRSMRIAARLADEFNLSSGGPERVADRTKKLDETCRAAGRDPRSLARSAMVGALVGRDDTEVGSRTRELMNVLGNGANNDAWLAEPRKRWIIGTPDQARAMVGRFADAGIERIMLQDFLPWDLDMIDLMAEELVGRV